MPLDPLPPRNVSGTDIEGDGNVATEEKHVYPGGLKLALIIAALASSVFLVALVSSPALPAGSGHVTHVQVRTRPSSLLRFLALPMNSIL